MGAIDLHADTRNSIESLQADIGAVHADVGVVGAAQAETKEVLENVILRLERLYSLQTSPVPKFAPGLDLNPSLLSEMTVAPYHSTIEPEIGPGVLRRRERLINKPTVDYRQETLQPRWPIYYTAVSSNPGPMQTLCPSSSSEALQKHEHPSAVETVTATLVERGRNVTVLKSQQH